MRRNSPPRFVGRRGSPPRRAPPPPRPLSPLSRNQPAPPGEERGRKSNLWESSPHKRLRSRSRSRERMVRPRESERDRPGERFRERLDIEPPIIRMSDERSREKERELPKDIARIEKGRSRDGPRDRLGDRIRDSGRDLHAPKFDDIKDPKRKHQPKGLRDGDGHHSDNGMFEESYLDRRDIRMNHDELILDPSSITFDNFMRPPESLRENPKNRDRAHSRDKASIARPPPRPQRESHRSPPLHRDEKRERNREREPEFKKSSNKSEKTENADERIKRLEKLVEKLVEGNGPSKESGSGAPKVKGKVPELIPSNTKFTTSMWINRIHEECLARNFDERSSILYMRDQMTGIMKAWFKSVSNYDFTWPELKLLITKTFPDNVDFAATLKLLVARDKMAEETITQYYFSKMYLCEACKITGENAVSCLIDGLSNPFMKQDIKSLSFMTPEALYSEYFSKYPDNDIPVRGDHREVREVIPSYRDDFIPLEVEDPHYRMAPNPPNIRGEPVDRWMPNQPEHPRDVPRDFPGEKGFDRLKCFTCKKFGHSTLDCRHAPICYNCKKKGHIAAKCHFNNVFFFSSMDSLQNKVADLPTVRCLLGKKSFSGFIDTGAETVTITEDIAKYLKLNVENTNVLLKGYGEGIVQPLGETNVKLTVDSAEQLVKILVVSNKAQEFPVIIGREFLGKDGIGFSMQNGVLKVFMTNETKVEI